MPATAAEGGSQANVSIQVHSLDRMSWGLLIKLLLQLQDVAAACISIKEPSVIFRVEEGACRMDPKLADFL